MNKIDILQAIEQRPHMYVGGFGGPNLKLLHAFMSGVNAANQRGYILPEDLFDFEFTEFVNQQLKINNRCLDWCSLILEHIEDGPEAIQLAFDLYREFLATKAKD